MNVQCTSAFFFRIVRQCLQMPKEVLVGMMRSDWSLIARKLLYR
jgi:hypothetical protein